MCSDMSFRLNSADNYLEQAFSRNLGLINETEQQKLRESRIAIAGLGGVGGVHLLTLTRTGIGKFHIADLDSYEIGNVNRQVSARVSTLNRQKVDVMVEDALAINPYLEIKTFPQGITKENIDTFLEGVSVVVDGLDFFEFDIRRLLFNRAREKGIYVVTAGPVGFGVVSFVFSPVGGMTFDEYFDVKETMSVLDKTVKFLLGIAPNTDYWKYYDFSKVSGRRKSAPSLGLACQLCSGVAATEVVKILLKRGRIKPAPHYFQFDPYLQRYFTGYLFWGNRNPLQRLKMHLARKMLTRPMGER